MAQIFTILIVVYTLSLAVATVFLPFAHGGFNNLSAAAWFRILSFFAFSLWLLIPRKLPSSLSTLKLPLALFILFTLLSTVFSVNFHDSFFSWLNILCYICAFIIVLSLFEEYKPSKVLSYFVILLGFSVAVWNFYKYIEAAGALEVPDYTFGQADALAGYIILIAPFALSLYLGSRRAIYTFICGTVAALLFANLYLTNSRGGILIVLVLSFFVFTAALVKAVSEIENSKKIIRLFVLLIAVSLLTFVFIRAFTPGFTGKVLLKKADERTATFFKGHDTSREARLTFWRAALEIAKDNPVFGTGFHTFVKFYPRHQYDIRYFSKYVHNLYLQFAAEAGFPALIAFLWLIGVIFVKIVRGCRKSFKNSDDFPFVIGIMASFSGFLLHSCIDVDWEFTAVALLFWVMTAAGVSYAEEKKKKEPDSEKELQPFALRKGVALQFVVAVLFVILIPVSSIPYFAGKYMDIANILERDGQYSKSIEFARKAVITDSLDGDLRKRLAEIYFENRKKTNDPAAVSEALDAINNAIRLDPERASNYLIRGRIYKELGQKEEALKNLRKAVVLDPVDSPDFYMYLAMALIENGQYQEAVKRLQFIIGTYPFEVFEDMLDFRSIPVKRDIAGCSIILGQIYQRMGKTKEAEAEFKRAVLLAPEITKSLEKK